MPLPLIPVLAATPIGWVIGAALVGGGLVYGVSRLVNSQDDAINDKEPFESAQHKIGQKKSDNLANLSQSEVDSYRSQLLDAVSLNLISQDFADKLLSLLINGDIELIEAIQTLENLKTEGIMKEMADSSERKALLWILDLQVKQGTLSKEQVSELISLVDAENITEAQALKSLESYLSNFGFFYILAPIMLKLALLDGVLHPAEIHAIKDYFVKEMNYQPFQVEQGVIELLATIEQVSLDELSSTLSLYIDEHHEPLTSAKLKDDIISVLERVVKADGHVDDKEQSQLTRIKSLFVPKSKAQNSALFETMMMDELAKRELASRLMQWKDEILISVFDELCLDLPNFMKCLDSFIVQIPTTFGFINAKNKTIILQTISEQLAVYFRRIVEIEASKRDWVKQKFGLSFNFEPSVIQLELKGLEMGFVNQVIQAGIINYEKDSTLAAAKLVIPDLFSSFRPDGYLIQLSNSLNQFVLKANRRII